MSHDLFEAARDAMKFAHAPYSKFPVGAAIRADDGRIPTPVNIENLSFPQGWCAEPTAIGCRIMGGAKKIVEMAVIAEKMALCPPCGGCRQKIAEFAEAGTKIYLCDEVGVQKTMTMDELGPFSFKTDIRMREAINFLVDRLDGLSPRYGIVVPASARWWRRSAIRSASPTMICPASP